MKVWVFENEESKKVMVTEEQRGVIIYTSNGIDEVQERCSQWEEIDWLKNMGKLKYVATVRTFHKPWADLFNCKF